MELLAAIVGLEALKEPCRITLYSDSQYLVDTMRCGSAREWRRNGWRLQPPKTKKALNRDLWKRLLELCDKHAVTLEWIRGHDNVRENERCDQLAVRAAQQNELNIDTVYETANPLEVRQLQWLERRIDAPLRTYEKITRALPVRALCGQLGARPAQRSSKSIDEFDNLLPVRIQWPGGVRRAQPELFGQIQHGHEARGGHVRGRSFGQDEYRQHGEERWGKVCFDELPTNLNLGHTPLPPVSDNLNAHVLIISRACTSFRPAHTTPP
jgi:ribonuclease HI